MTVGPLRGFLTSGEVAPYSATQEFSRTQTLADGTIISPKSPTEKTWRDSQGRIRTERPFCRMRGLTDPGTYVEIRDPIAGYAYILDATTHTAHRFVMKVRERGTPPPKPAEVAATLGAAILPAATTDQFVSQSLGSQTMEGVSVDGRRTTHTIPTGEMDNDRPFTIVREDWTSPLLHVLVYSKEIDPRFGESVTRLTDIQLSEPDPALFQVPADYTIVDDAEAVKLTLQRPNPAAPPEKPTTEK